MIWRMIAFPVSFRHSELKKEHKKDCMKVGESKVQDS